MGPDELEDKEDNLLVVQAVGPAPTHLNHFHASSSILWSTFTSIQLTDSSLSQ